MNNLKLYLMSEPHWLVFASELKKESEIRGKSYISAEDENHLSEL